jgi:hypothetical protein
MRMAGEMADVTGKTFQASRRVHTRPTLLGISSCQGSRPSSPPPYKGGVVPHPGLALEGRA